MLFAEKWLRLEIIMLRDISQLKKPNIACSRSFLEPRFKVIMMIVRIGCRRDGCSEILSTYV
jgi:hypothetical protein